MTTEHAAMIAEFHLAQQRRQQRLRPSPEDPPRDPAGTETVEVAVRVEMADLVTKVMAELPFRS